MSYPRTRCRQVCKAHREVAHPGVGGIALIMALVDRLRGVERALDCVLDDREIGEQVRAGARRQAFHSAHAFETSVEQGEGAAEIPSRLVGDGPDPLECAE